jgi:hypothetical protein
MRHDFKLKLGLMLLKTLDELVLSFAYFSLPVKFHLELLIFSDLLI